MHTFQQAFVVQEGQGMMHVAEAGTVTHTTGRLWKHPAKFFRLLVRTSLLLRAAIAFDHLVKD